MKMRKIRRKLYKFGTLLFCLAIVCILLLYDRSTKPEDKLEMSILVERSIRSPINQGPCRHPHLPIDNPEIMKFYKSVSKIDCGNSLDDWVMCEKSICFVKPAISAVKNEVICSYTDLIRKTDFRVKYGKTTKTSEPYVLQESDFVKVVCSAPQSGESWSGMAFGIRDTIPQRTVENTNNENSNDILLNKIDGLPITETPPVFNVLIYGFDSLSRNAFMRKLPKTYSYLKEQLKSIVLEGYNVIGDGTTMALVPLLTGYTELELPETRKRVKGSMYVNVYPFIWKDYERQGYMTSFNEDVPSIGTFTYRLNGFEQQPTDHYLRTYYLETQNIWSSSKEHCIGHQPDHVVMLNYTKEFMLKYSDRPRFVFSFHGGLSHDSINLIGAADDDVEYWLQTLKEKQLLDNTILVIMSDHGNRFHDVRATLQGKQEERLPFYSFSFPESFQKHFPDQYKNFVNNAKRLVTPFDVHATLKHILQLNTNNAALAESSSNDEIASVVPISKMAQERAISLFDIIAQNRSCADAYIAPHWCACLKWHPVPSNDTDYKGLLLQLANNIVETINAATESYRNFCAPLELLKINWAMRLLPYKEMLQFKNSGDQDGFIPDLTDNTRVHEEIYQLQIVVNPGASLFEASVTLDLETLQPQTKLADISRINKYGSQANCIYERNPDLRKYCYCRT